MNQVWLDSISAFLGVELRRGARLYTACKSESFFCYCNENRKFVIEAACPPKECHLGRKESKGLWLTRQVTHNIGNENSIMG